MKKLLSKLFSKLVLYALIIILQFGWIVYITYQATTKYSLLNVFLHVISIAMALYVVDKDMKPYFKLSWIFVILCLPIFGCPAYFLFGSPDLTKRARERLCVVAADVRKHCTQKKEILEEVEKQDEKAYKQMYYLSQTAEYPAYREEDSKYYPSGEEMFPQMLEDIDNAKDFIFLEYFIIQPGKMFDTMVEHLEKKAKEGVHIRLIYDDVGCINTLPPKYYKTLQAKGIHCACFNPFRPFLSVIMNNRDHRKIFVIDGKIAYTGGINLADEYINEVVRFGYWKDTGVRITGEAVWSFTCMFLEMWNYIVRGTEDYERFRASEKSLDAPVENLSVANAQTDTTESAGNEECACSREDECGYVQPYADSPLSREHTGENVYLNMITSAQHYIYIYAPYLIIDSEISTALVNAAKCGVDVRVMTPGIPDKKMVYLLTKSHYAELLRGGVKIYQYTPGFVHAKCFVADDKYAVVGSINLDYRSLCLHFECASFFYKAKAVMEVKDDFENTLKECEQISLAQCENWRLPTRLVQAVLRLFAPLL